jgi:hypothetical protein
MWICWTFDATIFWILCSVQNHLVRWAWCWQGNTNHYSQAFLCFMFSLLFGTCCECGEGVKFFILVHLMQSLQKVIVCCLAFIVVMLQMVANIWRSYGRYQWLVEHFFYELMNPTDWRGETNPSHPSWGFQRYWRRKISQVGNINLSSHSWNAKSLRIIVYYDEVFCNLLKLLKVNYLPS